MKRLPLFHFVAALFVVVNAGGLSAQTYNESGGLLIMEMENTPSALGQWVKINPGGTNYVSGATGSGHLEFTGNTINGGDAASPLTYTFQINQAGNYHLNLRARKRLDGEETDKCNDCYVKVAGDFTSGSGEYPTAALTTNTKLYGGNAGNWGWATNLDSAEADHVPAIYNFKAGETYVLTISGRSIRFNLDRIVFRLSSVAVAAARDTSQPESSLIGGGTTYTYAATSDFPDITAGAAPYYVDATRSSLAIDATVTSDRGLFARASRTFDGAAGRYDVTITALGEIDGECSYRFLVNGAVMGTATNGLTGTDYVPQAHTFYGVTISAGTTVAVESNTHSNGEVPETDGFAWARGRWTQLSLSESSGTPGPDGPVTIPGRIEAEDYMFGGEGLGYHDTTAGNTGEDYRADDVDVQVCNEGGFNVGWTAMGEWLDYEITAPQAGAHDVTVRVATIHDAATFKLQLNGVDLTAAIPVPNTGAWQGYQDVVIPDLSFPAGASILRFEVTSANGFNLNYIQIGEAVQPNTVTQFILVDADSDTDIGPLNDGDTLSMSLLPTANLNVRAETFPSTVGSVRFALDGNANFKTESVAPYALAGDEGGDYNPWTPALGAHILTATPFTEAAAAGSAGTALTVNFTVEATDPGLPVVDAGGDEVVTLPASSVVLTGTATDEGAVMATVWTQQSGPNTATLSGASTLSLTASGLVQGSYVFRLTATDDESHTADDEVNVTVVPEGSGDAVITGELKKWHKVTLSFIGPATSETATPNPFTDYRLNVTFIHPVSGKRLVVPGYYAADGSAADSQASAGKVWRAHIAPEEAGTWTYAASFRAGTNVATNASPTAGVSAGYFDGAAGSFEILPTDKSGRDHRGKGRLEYVGKHHLRFAETGEYFLKCGADAPENFLAYDDFDDTPNDQDGQPNRRKSWSPHAGDYDASSAAPFTWQGGKGTEMLGAVRYLSEKGMNAFSFLTFSLDGDDDNVFPHRLKSTVAAYEAVSDNQRWAHANGVHHERFDVSKTGQWERVFEYADQMGMYLHFKTQETENDQRMDGGALGSERKLYYRELVARFGHHLALNWNLGEENTNTDAQRKAFAQWFYDNDPYRHNVVLHSYPGDKTAVYRPMLGTGSTLTGLSLQTNQTTFSNVFSDTRTWVQNSAAAGAPWVVACDEPGDAQHSLRPAGDAGNSWEDGRKNALWGNVMAGGAGLEFYFGYAHDHSDLTCEDYRSRDGFWDYGRHMLEFFANFGAPFQDMSNEDALSSNSNSWCLRKPGESYLVYLKSGGTTNLNLSGAAGEFTVRWYDPRNGGGLQAGSVATVTGGGTRFLGTAPGATGSDWAVLVSKAVVADVPTFAKLFPVLDPDADTNGNGQSNYFEYASGFDPSSSTIPATGPFLEGPEVYTHPMRTGVGDVFVSYEFSVDIEGGVWTPMVEGTHYTLDLTDPVNPRLQLNAGFAASGLTLFFRHRFTTVAP